MWLTSATIQIRSAKTWAFTPDFPVWTCCYNITYSQRLVLSTLQWHLSNLSVQLISLQMLTLWTSFNRLDAERQSSASFWFIPWCCLLKQNQCVNTARGAVYLPRWKVICVCLWNTTLDMKPGHTQIQSFIHSLIHSFIHAFTFSFLYFSFIHSVIHLYIYLSMFYFWQNWFPHVQQLNSCEHCHFNVTTLSW